MTKLHSLITVIFVFMTSTSVALAQNPIPNPGFELWDGTLPEEWFTSNLSAPGTITQSADAHSGNWALQGDVVEFLPGYFFPPYFQTANALGFPVSERYETLRAFLKFNPVDSDVVFLTVVMKSGGTTTGTGIFIDSTGSTSYNEVVVPITYLTPDIPDSAVITGGLGGGGASEQVHLGSWFRIDDFSFSGADTGGTSCPVIATGDANQDGIVNSTDIIYLVNYVLKGGPLPLLCAAVGDANCDEQVNSTDIIYLVNYVLKGGPAPCDVCTLVPGTWACP
jgi:hypothetical protein